MTLFKQASQAAQAFTPPAPVLPVGLGDDAVLAASSALTGEVTIPNMTRPFLAHQAAAFNYANDSIARWGCAFFGDDMGMGKTQPMLALIAQALMQDIMGGGYAILVGPPVALGTYESEIAAAFPHLRLAHLKGRTRTALPLADVYFLSDDALTLKAWLTDGEDEKKMLVTSALARNAAIYVRDEIHRDKGNNAKPTGRARVGLAVTEALRAAGRPIVVATGTLLTNRPIEAVIPLRQAGGDALLKALAPGARTRWDFVRTFCAPEKGRYGYTYGGRNLPVLHENLRRTVYVRREKSDLGDLLPHGGWIITPLALNGTMARYRRIEKDFLAMIRDERGPEAMWKAARAEAIVQMQAMWQEAGVAKAKAAAEVILDLVNDGRKVIAFYIHRDVRDALAKHLVKAGVETVLIDGSVTGDGRKAAEAAIQTGTAMVCLAQIKAAGVAITLTAASEAVFVQVPWSAGDLAQAASRIKRADAISIERARRGEAVTFHVLQAAYEDGKPTFDMAMWGVLESKAAICDAVNAGRDITLPDESITEQALQAWYDTAG